MEHRGVEYRIIQGIKPGDWKWSVLSDTAGRKSGQAIRREDAVNAAKHAIDLALAPNRQRLSAPRRERAGLNVEAVDFDEYETRSPERAFVANIANRSRSRRLQEARLN